MPLEPSKVDFQPVGGGAPITSINAGDSFDIEVQLDSTTTSALTVSLSVPSGSPVSVPSTLTVAANSDQGRVTATSSAVSGNTSVTVTASANGGSASASILLLAGH